jgi:hypothetical protein
MFKRTFLRVSLLVVILATVGILVFAGRKSGEKVQESPCPESQEQCDKAKAQGGEYIILEALNRAVTAVAR